MEAVWGSPTYVADQNGAGGAWQQDESGNAFTVSIISKLAMLGILKFSTLDPQVCNQDSTPLIIMTTLLIMSQHNTRIFYIYIFNTYILIYIQSYRVWV